MKDIDKKLIETINRYTTSGIEQQVDYEKFYLYSLITHSTAIEGSTVTEVENLKALQPKANIFKLIAESKKTARLFKMPCLPSISPTLKAEYYSISKA